MPNIIRLQELWDIYNNEKSEEERKIKSKDYISAGEIGFPFLDRWLKMKGVKPSNPYEPRVKRIFNAGNAFHDTVKETFKKLGILVDTEQYIEIPATKKTLKIIGYYDARVKIKDWNKVELSSESRKQLAEKYTLKPNVEYLVEIKSINSNAFWYHKNFIAQGYKHHQFQLYTYLKATNIQQGKLLYISKDDLTLEETPIFLNNEKLAQEWQKDVETITYYYKNNIKPKKEADLIFNRTRNRYEKNWRVGRSLYLTYITGKTKKEWEDETTLKVKAFNKKLKEEG